MTKESETEAAEIEAAAPIKRVPCIAVYLSAQELTDLLGHLDDSRHGSVGEGALVEKLEEAYATLVNARIK